MIPEPFFTLINTSIGDDPAVVVVNSALRTFKDREDFPWHLRVSIECKLRGANGMQTNKESEALQQLEDSIEAPLKTDQNAIFLARITARSERVLLYRIHDPDAANDALQSLVSTASPLREWDYQMEYDIGWDLAQPELHLLEHDPRFN